MSRKKEPDKLKSRIKEVMADKGITAYRLAKLFDMTHENQIYRFINTEYLDQKNLFSLYRIAKALGCQIEDLFIEES